MSTKKRLMKLAGIDLKEDSETTELLEESLRNLGMVNPGIIGNPFTSSAIAEQDGWGEESWGAEVPENKHHDEISDLRSENVRAKNLLHNVLKISDKYDLAGSEDEGSSCETLLGEIKDFLYDDEQ